MMANYLPLDFLPVHFLSLDVVQLSSKVVVDHFKFMGDGTVSDLLYVRRLKFFSELWVQPDLVTNSSLFR